MAAETFMEIPSTSSGAFNLAAPRRLITRDGDKSIIDPLTGLLTQTAFETRVTQTIAAAEPSNHLNALLRLDLDRFIRINDCFGFATGDALLSKFGQKLQWAAEAVGGIAGRLDQDEFVLFAPAIADREKVMAIAHQVLRSVTQPIDWNGRRFFLTASMGVALHPDDADDIGSLLSRAAHEQQSVRNRGMNGVQIARPHAAENRSPVAQNTAALRRAIEREEIFLVYQPILNLHSRQLVGVEALLRWHHPEHGILSPDQFLPLANETGLIVDLGEWALSNACGQLHAWDQLGFDGLHLCVNFSSQQLQTHKVVSKIESILGDTKLDPTRLSIELSAAGRGTTDASTMRTLREMNESGIKLALDNFGVGALSLDDLHDLPLDSLKIDRSVIRKVNTSSNGENLVRALTMLGKSFGLTVEAEGVETSRQFDLLDREGCNNAQGYLLSKPLAPDGVTALLHGAGDARHAMRGD
jgi:diguanylate cyclase (GGDEF)-like protein